MKPAVPTLELPSLASEDASALAALSEACEQWGFFRLVDTGISAKSEQAFFSAVATFFSLSKHRKSALRRNENNPWGYYDQELTKNRQDWKEIFDLGHDQTDPHYESKTPWPADLPRFKTVMLDWHQQCERISLTLLEAIAQVLGAKPIELTRYFQPDNNSSFLRLNHYPVCHEPASAEEDFPNEGHLGIYHHTDAGAVTVLLADEVSGLQVRHHNQWVTIPGEPGSLIINVGDLVQVWSNDRFKAPLHRVLANSEQERYSAAFFMNPAFSTQCTPIADHHPRYHPVNWGEFRSARAAGDYANVGEEIQISRYRIR